MPALPTPDEWNALYKKPEIDTRKFAPVQCPHCGARMYYPYFDDAMAAERIVRCASNRSCTQTTIANMDRTAI